MKGKDPSKGICLMYARLGVIDNSANTTKAYNVIQLSNK